MRAGRHEQLQPGVRLGLLQLQALLWRNWRLKRRAWVTTLVELLSPIILVGLLVFAYHLVNPDHIPQRIFAGETSEAIRNITRSISKGATSAASGLQPGQSDDCTQLIDQIIEQNNGSWSLPPSLYPGNTSAAFPLPHAQSPSLAPAPSGGPPVAGNITAAQQEALRECFQLGRNTSSSVVLDRLGPAVQAGLQAFIDTNGPVPIPTLDEFILASQALQAAVQQDPEALSAVRGARRSFGWNVLGNLLDLGQIAFAPNTPDVLRLAHHLSTTHAMFAEKFYGVLETEADGEALALAAKPSLWALVVFNAGPNTSHADYTIRMNFTVVPRTWSALNKHRHDVSISYKEYYTSGFLSLQAAIDGYVLGQSTAHEAALGPLGTANPSAADNPFAQPQPQYWTAWGAAFPTAAYDHNQFYDAVGPMLGLVLCLSLLFPLSMLVRGIVEEKETRAKETMCIMGLEGWPLHASWAITYGLVFTAVAVSVTVTCCLSFMTRSSPSLLFVSLLLFNLSELAFGMLVASVFSNAKLAAICAPILHFSALMPRYIFFRTGEPQALLGKALVSLLSPSAFTFAADLFASYEGAGDGVGWADLWADPFPLGVILIMLTVDIKLYATAGWYLEKVMPGAHGPRLPMLFPLFLQYWRTGDASDVPSLAQVLTRGCQLVVRLCSRGHRGFERISGDDLETGGGPAGGEQAAEGAARGLRRHSSGLTPRGSGLRGLPGQGPTVFAEMHRMRKEYGNKVAVHGLSLQLHEGQLTSLLGHNGAGKTTAIGMLSGLIRPTGGDCTIMGHSMVTSAPAARQCLGFCPQQNILFGQLTAREHVLLYAAIKGLPGGYSGVIAHEAADAMLEAVGLANKAGTEAQALSGGMKRKLQVALALLGDSPVVLLDEPSSGVDPVSRRALWAILSQWKAGRAMLLTTHFMDEADVLSDQVAIMSEGDLICSGTSFSLKQQWSNGYALTLTQALDREEQPDAAAIEAMVLEHVPGSRLLRSAGAELVYRLPMDQTASFGPLLEQLESQQAALGIGHCAVSMPTLEEVFLESTGAAHAEDPAAIPQGNIAQRIEARVRRDVAAESPTAPAVLTAFADDAHAQPAPQASWLGRAHGSAAQPPPMADGGASFEAHMPSPEHVNTPVHDSSPEAVGVDSTAAALPDGVASFSGQVQELQSVVMHAESDRSGLVQHTLLEGTQHKSSDDSEPSTLSQTADESPCASTAASVSSPYLPQTRGSSPQQPRSTAAGAGMQRRQRSHARQCILALGEMLKKRANIAARDRKGLAFMALVPLVAISLVMLILSINIDPTSPTMTLQLEGMLPGTRIGLAQAPRPLADCLADGPPPACGSEHAFQDWTWGDSSYNTSQLLLQKKAEGRPPQYAGLVFNDTMIHDIATALTPGQSLLAQINGSALPDASTGALPSSPLLDPTAAAALLAALLPLGSSSTSPADFATALASSRNQARVIQRAVARFTAEPPVTLMHNTSARHALPALVSAMHETISALNQPAASLTVRSHPLPLTAEEGLQLDNILMVLASLFVLVPFCLASGAFSISPVTERSVGAHHMQLLAGCPPAIYWLGSYLWDLALHAFVCVAAVAIFAAYGDEAFAGSSQQALGTFCLLLEYGAAVIPLAYCYSFAFGSPSAAQVAVAALNFLFGFGTVTASYVMQVVPKTQAAQRVLVHLFRLFPPFLMGEGLIQLTAFHFFSSLAEVQGEGEPSAASVFQWDTLGRPLILLAAETVALCLLTVALDANMRTGWAQSCASGAWDVLKPGRRKAVAWLWGSKHRAAGYERTATDQDFEPAAEEVELGPVASRPLQDGTSAKEVVVSMEVPRRRQEDDDVIAERARIEDGRAQADRVQLRHLRKVYATQPPKVAVHDLCLGVRPGERFGLLGPNGAGKTTTLGMLTGAISVDGGEAVVEGVSVTRGGAAAGASLGYCPQHDPLLEHLTAREQLALYARLKGIPREQVGPAVAEVIARVSLPVEMSVRASGQLSGGNKRKLALGIALVGGTSALLLDEPSSGMDPGARRAMWAYIEKATQGEQGRGVAVMLTTHSMEECEALCGRVGIMHAGRLACLASPTRLKHLYGDGYLMEVHAADSQEVTDRIAAHVQQHLAGSETEERRFGRLKFLVPSHSCSLAYVFKCMESVKEAMGIVAYGVSMPTLEQVFLNVIGESLHG